MVGIIVGCGGGSVGSGPMPALTGSVALSPHAVMQINTAATTLLVIAERMGPPGAAMLIVRHGPAVVVRAQAARERTFPATIVTLRNALRTC